MNERAAARDEAIEKRNRFQNVVDRSRRVKAGCAVGRVVFGGLATAMAIPGLEGIGGGMFLLGSGAAVMGVVATNAELQDRKAIIVQFEEALDKQNRIIAELNTDPASSS